MTEFLFRSRSEQLAEHLRQEIMGRRWIGTMPGAPALAAETGVERKTVTRALAQLEREGLLVSQGPRQQRRIKALENLATATTRIAMLLYEPLRETSDKVFLLKQRLTDEGHTVVFANKSQLELGFNVRKIARIVQRTPADAWIVHGGSQDVLAWFAEQETPAFARFGRRSKFPIAGVGPDHVAAGRTAV